MLALYIALTWCWDEEVNPTRLPSTLSPTNPLGLVHADPASKCVIDAVAWAGNRSRLCQPADIGISSWLDSPASRMLLCAP
jgi:hypothetical protein